MLDLDSDLPEMPLDPKQDEQNLLARCKKLDLRYQEEDPRDILYHTPCDRWIRICPIGSDDFGLGDPDASEVVIIITSTIVSRLLRDRSFPQLKELQEFPSSKDTEIGPGPENFQQEFHSFLINENLRLGKTEGEALPKFRNAYGQSEADPEYQASVSIPRGALVLYLLKWSKEWPLSEDKELEKTFHSLNPCMKSALTIIYNLKTRIKRDDLKSLMAKLQIQHGDSTINNAMGKLGKLGLVVSGKNSNSRGYGLTESGKRMVENFLNQGPT